MGITSHAAKQLAAALQAIRTMPARPRGHQRPGTCLLLIAAVAGAPACVHGPAETTPQAGAAAVSGKAAMAGHAGSAGTKQPSAGAAQPSAGRLNAGAGGVAARGGAGGKAQRAGHGAGGDDADAGLAAAGSGGAPPDTSISFEAAMQSYKSWSKASAEPQAITDDIFSLCRGPTKSEQAFVMSEHGQLLLLDWLNEGAAAGFAAKGASPFPHGAAIVKQKLERKSSGELEVKALGIMIKRAAGFDPAHGDWAFGYWAADSGLEANAEVARSCGGCHASSKTDFVFLDGSWRLMP